MELFHVHGGRNGSTTGRKNIMRRKVSIAGIWEWIRGCDFPVLKQVTFQTRILMTMMIMMILMLLILIGKRQVVEVYLKDMADILSVPEKKCDENDLFELQDKNPQTSR